MTLEEALAELGVDASATPDEVRRAYLRGTKTRKPESDPEGFRRLRDAYEVATGAVRPEATAGTEEDEEETEGFEELEEETPPELAGLASRLAALPAETRLEERLEALRQAVREHPASEGVRWWLAEELGRAGREEELLAVLRQAEVDGLPGFLEARAARFPGSVEDPDLASLELSPDPEVLAILARVHLTRSRPEAAVVVLGHAVERLRALDGDEERPVPSWLPRGLLSLEAAGRAAEAQALHDRIWSWLTESGDAGLLQRWGASHPWRVAHELGRLGAGFPAPLRRAAAHAALEGDSEAAVAEAKEYAKKQPAAAEQASTLLYDLPMLYNLYYRTLQGIVPGRPQAAAGGQAAAAWTVLFRLLGPILLTGIFLSRCPDSQSPADYRMDTMRHESTRAWGAMEGHCAGTGLLLPHTVCQAAQRAVAFAQSGDCLGAHQALEEMNEDLNDLRPAELEASLAFQERMLQTLSIGCGPYVMPPRKTATSSEPPLTSQP